MRCPKCSGLVIDDYDADLRVCFKKCLNCGFDPERVVQAITCKYTNCMHIPVHGTICTKHIGIAGRKRSSMMQALEKARAVRWKKEDA